MQTGSSGLGSLTVKRQTVDLDDVGSSPILHPIKFVLEEKCCGVQPKRVIIIVGKSVLRYEVCQFLGEIVWR